MLLLVPLLAGCYEMVPTTTRPPSLGDRVAVKLSAEGSARMTAQVGPGVAGIEGRLASMTDSALTLDVILVRTAAAGDVLMRGITATVPRTAVEALEVERLSVRRTSLFIGGLTAGVVLAGRAIGLANGGGSEAGLGGRGTTRY